MSKMGMRKTFSLFLLAGSTLVMPSCSSWNSFCDHKKATQGGLEAEDFREYLSTENQNQPARPAVARADSCKLNRQ